jgi:hypothetical protein
MVIAEEAAGIAAAPSAIDMTAVNLERVLIFGRPFGV